jgi:hypothetical protein
MVEQGIIIDAVGNLISWMETWRDEQGAYNGFVVHRTEAKRMGRVHDTAWTQSAVIRGYGNLYRKSREKRWGEAMALAADPFANRYDPDTGRIVHTGHEDDRFQSLVSCALGVCALLSIADLVDEARRADYIRIATEHVRRYWFDVLWVEAEGAFKFAATDYFSLKENRFVINFNTMAAEALLALYAVTKDQVYFEKARSVGDWLIAGWDRTQKVNERILAGKTTVADDPSSDWMAPGGFSYQFTANQREPDNYVTLYTGLSLRGFVALYRATGDERFAAIIRAQSSYLLAMRDPETRLFLQTTRQGRIVKNPLFIAGAGMTLVGLHEAEKIIGVRAVPEETILSILGRAYPNGSFPNFSGMNDRGSPRRSGGGVVWEDAAATMSWNAQLFEYLTRFVEEPARIIVTARPSTLRMVTKRFIYIDSPESVNIVSWWPPRSWGLYFYTKRRRKAWVSLYPMALYGRIRSWLRGV